MPELICVQCKSIGKPKRKKRGSLRLEITGWLLFPLGLPYTLWRILAPRTPVCKHCGSESLLPVDSIAGQRMVKIAAGEDVTMSAEIPRQPVPKQPALASPEEPKPKPKVDPKVW